MGSESAITWTDATWNPWQGCHKVSAGCLNCYMYRDKTRYGQDPGTVVRSKPKTFNAPKKWDEPKVVFVCSWSDFFIEEADEWRQDAYDVMDAAPQHIYLLLTKRPERLIETGWRSARNRWLGVTVENNDERERIDIIAAYSAGGRFVSYEPALGPLDLPKACGIDWLICAGESGPNARAMDESWARHIKAQCDEQGIIFHMKQMGGYPDKRVRLEAIPEDLRVRENPDFWGEAHGR